MLARVFCHLVITVRVASNRESVADRCDHSDLAPKFRKLPLFPGKPVIITKSPEILSLQWTPEFIAEACGKVLYIC